MGSKAEQGTALRALHNRSFLVPAPHLAHNQKSSQVQYIPPSLSKKDVSFNEGEVLKSVLLN